jgi:succinate-semialdehyde dehydrogenase / glutarate-semialdehyde dehydrogenase
LKRYSEKRKLQLFLIVFHSGFGKGEYTNMFISHTQAESMIADRRVRAVKFTGSTEAGKKVASLCGQHMKKGTFELGGNDPFIVLKEANVDLAVEKAYASRMAANGQACINAKRFIVNESRFSEFSEKLIQKIKDTSVIGDPMDPKVTVGPLAMAR